MQKKGMASPGPSSPSSSSSSLLRNEVEQGENEVVTSAGPLPTLTKLLRSFGKGNFSEFTRTIPFESKSLESTEIPAASTSSSIKSRKQRKKAPSKEVSVAYCVFSRSTPQELEAQTQTILRLIFSSLNSFADTDHRSRYLATLF